MRVLFLFTLLGLLLFPLRAEDWTTLDGKVYKDVRVISQTPAYVTILHDDGGGQIPLSDLGPALQQRFNYTPAAAAKYLADTARTVQANKDALASEKLRVQAQEAARQEAAAEAFFVALFTVPPDRDVPPTNAVASSSDDSVPPPDVATDTDPIASEPATKIDDWGYGDYGYGYNGYYGYANRGYTHYGTRGFNRSPYTGTTHRYSIPAQTRH